jgi:predicted negative regulator of RcsB-dependent stress response
MATSLDLQEQEQLDELKAFWTKYGNLITWLLTLALAAFVAVNLWTWYQRDQSGKASGMFDALEQAAQAGDADKTGRVFNELKDRFGRTAYAQQGALLTAKVQFEQGKADAGSASLAWAIEHALDAEYKALARLRMAALLLDGKKYDDALKQLDAVDVPAYAALVADRRGDVMAAQGKRDEAKAAYQQAWKSMDEAVEYRRLIEAKLTALGAPPQAASGAAK